MAPNLLFMNESMNHTGFTPMTWLKNKTVQEYVGVLVEVPEGPEGSPGKGVILQATDEEEYMMLEGHHLTPFLRQRVRIAGRLHDVEGKKALEALEVKPIQLTGILK
jgi:hypothetical protein